jgi:hypothetical protein
MYKKLCAPNYTFQASKYCTKLELKRNLEQIEWPIRTLAKVERLLAIGRELRVRVAPAAWSPTLEPPILLTPRPLWSRRHIHVHEPLICCANHGVFLEVCRVEDRSVDVTTKLAARIGCLHGLGRGARLWNATCRCRPRISVGF